MTQLTISDIPKLTEQITQAACSVVRGADETVHLLTAALLCGGHVLLEDLPVSFDDGPYAAEMVLDEEAWLEGEATVTQFFPDDSTFGECNAFEDECAVVVVDEESEGSGVDIASSPHHDGFQVCWERSLNFSRFPFRKRHGRNDGRESNFLSFDGGCLRPVEEICVLYRVVRDPGESDRRGQAEDVVGYRLDSRHSP